MKYKLWWNPKFGKIQNLVKSKFDEIQNLVKSKICEIVDNSVLKFFGEIKQDLVRSVNLPIKNGRQLCDTAKIFGEIKHDLVRFHQIMFDLVKSVTELPTLFGRQLGPLQRPP